MGRRCRGEAVERHDAAAVHDDDKAVFVVDEAAAVAVVGQKPAGTGAAVRKAEREKEWGRE